MFVYLNTIDYLRTPNLNKVKFKGEEFKNVV